MIKNLIVHALILWIMTPGNLFAVTRKQDHQIISDRLKNENDVETQRPVPGTRPVMLVTNFEMTTNNGIPGRLQGNLHTMFFRTGWVGVSSYIIPIDPTIENLFQQVVNNLIILYNQDGLYYPAQQVNTLINWDPYSGYVAKWGQEAVLAFDGQVIENRSLDLATGWNLVPVLAFCPVDVADLFDSQPFEMVKEVAGSLCYWPGMGIHTLEELEPGGAYYVLMNSPGMIDFPDCNVPTFPCGDDLVDERDGQVYATVLIGNQCWMAKNLNIGNIISSSTGGYQQSNNGIIEKYCYGNLEEKCSLYGGLYEWREAMQYTNAEGSKGICMEDWHVPTDQDWSTLTDFLGGSDVAGGALKSTGTIQAGNGLWFTPNRGATNASGFNAFPGGRRYPDEGYFINSGYYGFFWSSTKDDLAVPWLRMLSYANTDVMKYSQPAASGLSVRCILDCRPQPTSSDAGPDQINMEGTSTTLEGNFPNSGTGVWHLISGIDGNIIDTLNPHSEFQGLAAHSYFLTWTISNQCGNSVDTVLISFASVPVSPCPGIPTVVYEGEIYHTAQIGVQCWLKENLNTGIMVETGSGGQQQTNNGLVEKYCYYSGFSSHCDDYGGLYEWDEAMQYSSEERSRGICPEDWHIPDDRDWNTLASHLGGIAIAGGKMKSVGELETGTGMWHAPNQGADNVSGFNGLPGGWRAPMNGFFLNDHFYGRFWSSSQVTNGFAHDYQLSFDGENLLVNESDKFSGLSVRCIRDCNEPATPANAGPDQLNMPGNTVQLTANIPDVGTGKWKIINGTGGIIADTMNPASNFEGIANALYILTWTITGSCDISVDTVNISFAGTTTACPGMPTVEYGGQIYHTVLIGSQCWLKENLNIGTMIVSNTGGSQQSNDSIIEKYCYNNLISNCDIYGGLYEWDEAMNYDSIEGMQGICPGGWHIPTSGQMTMLAINLGGPDNAGGKLKSNGVIENGSGLWFTPNTGATNESDFTGLPGGFRKHDNGDFSGLGYWGYYRSSTKKNYSTSWSHHLEYNSAGFIRADNYRTDGFSIRCVRDCYPEPTPANAGPDQRFIPGTATALTGNIPESGSGVWRLISGNGGNIEDTLNAASEFTGLPMNSYTLTWTTSTTCGSYIDTVVISFSAIPSCPGMATINHEGKTYHTVLIGSQCWLKENLDVGNMIISNLSGQLQTNNGIKEKYCYNNDPVNCSVYGGLYEWDEAMQYVTNEGGQGLCPSGWHIATDGEFTILENFLGGSTVAGGKMKSTGNYQAGTGLWKSSNSPGTNTSGFTGYPSGSRYSNGGFYNLTTGDYFWSSTQKDLSSAWYRSLAYSYADLFRNYYTKTGGYSVRCIKN